MPGGGQLGGRCAGARSWRAAGPGDEGRRGRLDGLPDGAAARARRAVGQRADGGAGARAARPAVLRRRPARTRWPRGWSRCARSRTTATLFPAPRQRWVDALSLTPSELAAIDVPVLLIHGADDPIVPLADSALPLLRQAARRTRPHLRPLRPRLTARVHRRVQPPRTDLPGDLVDDRVRRPSQPLAGAVRGRDGQCRRPRRRRARPPRARHHRPDDRLHARLRRPSRRRCAQAGLDVAVFTDAEVDVPSTAVEAAVALGRSITPDVIVAVGGGSRDRPREGHRAAAHPRRRPVGLLRGQLRARAAAAADRAADHRRHRAPRRRRCRSSPTRRPR